jgi:pyruvate/2-oxoglutarate/acetoin dehydrogenase E1 component
MNVADNNVETKQMTMAAAITDAMDIMLGLDPNVVIYGEDVGNLGGVYRITTGLQKKHGEDRVFDSPLTESGIIGTAIGAGAVGMRPVVELQFGGFMMPAFDQIFSHVSRYRWRYWFTRAARRFSRSLPCPCSWY